MRLMQFETDLFADMHVHLRQGDLLSTTVREHGRYCDQVLAMPNTSPALTTPDLVHNYVLAVREIQVEQRVRFDVRVAFYLQSDMKADLVATLANLPEVVAAKLYPAGVTSNSDQGISYNDLRRLPEGPLAETLAALESSGLILSVHPEVPHEYVESIKETETDFLPTLRAIRRRFPKLRLVVEHVTTAAMVRWVQEQEPDMVAATVTPQHLLWDIFGLLGKKLLPLRFCKPAYKDPADRLWLLDAAHNAANVFLGSDSAPHHVSAKLNQECCAGVYSAPVLPELLAAIFGEKGRLDSFNAFVSDRARSFYRLPPATGSLVFTREEKPIPASADYPTPWDGGSLGWSCRRKI